MPAEYRLHHKHFTLFSDGKPSGRPCEQLSIAFDKTTGQLYKHGEPAMVQTFAALSLKRWSAQTDNTAARDLVVVTGHFPVALINRCIQEEGYCKEFLEELQEGQFDRAQVC